MLVNNEVLLESVLTEVQFANVFKLPVCSHHITPLVCYLSVPHSNALFVLQNDVTLVVMVSTCSGRLLLHPQHSNILTAD